MPWLMKGSSSDVQVYLSKIHSLRLLTLPSHRLLSRYRLIVAENPQAKAPVLFQVLLLLRIVRLELTINKLNPLDFGLGVDNKPQLRTAIGLYLSHETQPPKRTREGRFSPSPYTAFSSTAWTFSNRTDKPTSVMYSSRQPSSSGSWMLVLSVVSRP